MNIFANDYYSCGLSKKQIINIGEQLSLTHNYNPEKEDICSFVEQFGAEFKIQENYFISSIIKSKKKFDIFLLESVGTNRDYYTTAQEFGHFILHSKKGNILKENEILHFLRFYNDKINLEAHYFAKGLLLPTDLFKLKAEEFDNNIFELANYFKVSTQLINQRFEDFF